MNNDTNQTQPVVQPNNQPVQPTEPAQPAAPVYQKAMDDLGPVDPDKKAAFTPTIESLTPSMTEETAIKETQAATPTNMDSKSLIVEDTMLSNNLAQEVKQTLEMTPEEDRKDSNRKRNWIIGLAIFVVLVILSLPLVVKIGG